MPDVKYGDYIASQEYRDYYQRYFSQIRESDRVLIEMIRDRFSARLQQGESLKLIDIGCGSGQLLYHLKHQLPHLALTGADAYPAVVEQCRQNKDLAGITFVDADLMELRLSEKYDIVVVNAVLFLFDAPRYEQAVSNISALLAPGGCFFSFDFAHEYDQELIIQEKSASHPDGMYLHFYPRTFIEACFLRQGLGNFSLKPFSILVDLVPENPADNVSRTVKLESGERLIFRGTLFTPWCHLSAQKL
jgi:SAM-dependent methyltransferase